MPVSCNNDNNNDVDNDADDVNVYRGYKPYWTQKFFKNVYQCKKVQFLKSHIITCAHRSMLISVSAVFNQPSIYTARPHTQRA